jgi:hypothetical protein
MLVVFSVNKANRWPLVWTDSPRFMHVSELQFSADGCQLPTLMITALGNPVCHANENTQT